MDEKECERDAGSLPQRPAEPGSSWSTEKTLDDLDSQKRETSIAPPRSSESKANFEPIRSGTGARPSLALSRERSNNGFGVDNGDDSSRLPGTLPNDDQYDVSWDDGDNDPLNPRSMKPWRKWSIIFITSFGGFCVTNASSIYTSTYSQMDPQFGVSREVATLGLSTFVLGIALGPFWGPMAEFFGRRPIYLASFTFFLIFIIPSAVAQNIQTMIVARFLQGLAGSAFLSVSGGTVGDLFAPQQMHMPMAVFTMAPFVGPAMGPLIGGFINSFTHWRWTHYVLLIWAGALLVAIALFVPETYHPVMLKKKARMIRKQTGDERWKAPMEKSTKSMGQTVTHSLLRPFQILAFEPMALILNLYSALLLGIIYLFFSAFPLVFIDNHGFNLWQVGLTFVGLFVGMITGGIMTPFIQKVPPRLLAKRQRKFGEARPEPEDQLVGAIIGAPLIVIGLFWFGFTTYPSVHWIVPIIGSAVFSVGTVLAFTSIFTFLVSAYPLYAASALASNALVRCTFGAAFPLFGTYMYEGMGYQWATALLGFIMLAMLPFPYLFFRIGKKLRARSKFAAASAP